MDKLTVVFESTLNAIENGKEEIFNIYEMTRNEIQRLKKELEFMRREIEDTIKMVDTQFMKEKRFRRKLMEVNKNFDKFNEKQMLEAYSETKDAQVELQLLQAKELQLRSRRDEIERTLKNLDITVIKAEDLMSQVSLALRLLKEGISEISQFYSSDQRKETAFQIIKAQEEERLRVAREVHDGPAQSLANIVLRLEIAEKLLELDHRQVKKELKELNMLVRDNLKDIRRIIFGLRPIPLNGAGIVDTINHYMKNFEKTYGLTCELIVEGQERELDSSVEVALFRLVQEGMTNVAKHAESPKCRVHLNFQDDRIVGQIIDDGKGFDISNGLDNSGAHFGLIGINERIQAYSGQLSIQSELGKGTVVTFNIPYSE
ncbi:MULTISPECIES: sensor histidine kinase [Dehalobacter]|uniref:sensor histidine kinase n=1 Tax=Dehalobacter TaxID=56112 RepID=UPI00258599A6|nr:sensor histidine kinase [Dehalobacter sp.]MDJ0304609.1 sensor histidine kinase [Dehalobacter sp.]